MDLKNLFDDGIGKEIKEKVEEIVEKCKKDPSLLADLKDDPAGVLKKLGIDVDKEQIDKVVDMVKAGVAADKADDVLGKLGGLFGKK